MRILADFLLDSDLSLDTAAPPHTINAANAGFTLTISNASVDDRSRHDAVLTAQLIFEADTFDNLRAIAQEKLSVALNILVYTTNRKFMPLLLKRIIDWTPGVAKRRALIFTEVPEWDVAEPALGNDLVATAERLLGMNPTSEQLTAMRWYRLAIRSENPDEQFSCFWFALEIAAETLKGTERVPSKCPKCQGELYCEACKEHPTHRRYPGEAIRQVVERVHPAGGDAFFAPLQLIRHTLMHGGRIRSVLDQLPYDEQQAVNNLAITTWRALRLMFAGADPRPGTPLTFGDVDNVVRRTLVASLDIITGVPGDVNNPRIEDFPVFDVSIDRTPMPQAEHGIAQGSPGNAK